VIEMTPARSWFVTRDAGAFSLHLLSFGSHYDPQRIRVGGILAYNDHTFDPGAGFTEHPHSRLEIVSYIVSGSLEHRDSGGSAVVVRAGEVQRLSAASGVRHSELNASAVDRVRFVQVWLAAGDVSGPALYERAPVPAVASGLVTLADPAGGGVLDLDVPDTIWLLAALMPGAPVRLPSADRTLVHVLGAAVETVEVRAGEARARLGDGDAAVLTGEPEVVLEASAAATVLVWLLPC
jgi:redox-sensitive bicupin YhaK (pirin superfamily)